MDNKQATIPGLTESTAIADCKKLWSLVATGKAKNKQEALSMMPDTFIEEYTHRGCPLCTYDNLHNKSIYGAVLV